MLLGSSQLSLIVNLKNQLCKIFKMTDLNEVKKYLGFNILHDSQNVITIDQTDFIEAASLKFNILPTKTFNTPMEDKLRLLPADKANPSIKYRNLIGTLLYISTGTRPDVSFAVNYLSRFQNCCSETHYNYALRVLKYLYSTKDLKLTFSHNPKGIQLDAFSDSDHGSDPIDRKSTSGILIRLNHVPIVWKSQKQQVVSKASTHAEYYSLSETVTELLPIIGILKDFQIIFKQPIPIFEDNKGAYDLARNGRFHKNSKHIEIRYHFVYDYVKKNIIKIIKISKDDQLPDILTKPLGKHLFEIFRNRLSLK